MNNLYKYKINDNVNMMYIENDKFKTNVVTVYFKRPLKREEVTKNSLLPYVLKSSTKTYKTPLELDIKMQELYSSSVSASVEKIGEKHIISFTLSLVSDRFLPDNITQDALELLKEIIFMPNVENDSFIKQYVDIEKQVLSEDIKAEINSKGKYAFNKATELMFENEPFSIRQDGYLEDLDSIDEKNLYEYYQEFIKTSPIDIVVAGQFEKDKVTNYIKEIFDIKINPVVIEKEKIHEKKEFKQKEEKMDITQGKLVLGYTFGISPKDEDYYNFVTYVNILGGGAFSKLFANVREKHSLCYSIASTLQKVKGTMMITAGIEPENKQKTINLINEQIEDMKNGRITDIELDSAKRHYIHALTTLTDSLAALGDFYYAQSLSDTPRTIDEIIAIIERVGKDDIQKVAQKCQGELEYFLTKNE